MNSVTEKELNILLKDLPNSKASRIYFINYEMLKKLDTGGRKILKEFFFLCLDKGICPFFWKISTIFPISKSKEWECDLINTRLIILLEISRKYLTEIITNRLLAICKKHNILIEPN